MTNRVDFDRRLTSWLEEDAAPHAPGEMHARFIEGMASARQRPGWATTERWISMETRAQLGAVPRAAIVLATMLLLTGLTAGAVVVGSAVTTPAPNGLIAYPHVSGAIWVVEPDGSDPRALIEDGGTLSDPVWSPDGTRLAYWSRTGGSVDLVVSAADGSHPVVVAADAGESNGWPQVDWSPDGTQVAFSAIAPGAVSPDCVSGGSTMCGSRIFIAAADGSTGAIQVGDPDLDAREPVWSPDGSSIAFGAGNGPQDIRLHIMAPDGANDRVVGDLQGEGWALDRLDWSPDGTSVVGTSGLPVWDIWDFSVESGTERNLSGPSFETDEPVDRLFPTYAADGAIAWVGGWSGESCDCLTLREDDADPVNLPGFGGAPTWSPDGRYLVAGQVEGGANELVVIDRQGNVHATFEGAASESVSWKDSGG